MRGICMYLTITPHFLTTSSPPPLPTFPSQLEKYSTNLEAVVAERTMELAAEKAKTEELVCRMLISICLGVKLQCLSLSVCLSICSKVVLTVSIPAQSLNLSSQEQRTHDPPSAGMLPKTIVEQLKQGKQVSAETFDCVTIYFRYREIEVN